MVAENAGQRLADEAGLQSEHFGEAAVGEDDAALAVDGEDAFAHAVHDLLQQRVLKLGGRELAGEIGSGAIEARGDFVDCAERVDVERCGGFAVGTAEAVGETCDVGAGARPEKGEEDGRSCGDNRDEG